MGPIVSLPTDKRADFLELGKITADPEEEHRGGAARRIDVILAK